jgi:hypothetical protein
MTMKRWMETVNYRITEGSTYDWQCYGHNAYCLDSWNGEQDGHSFTIIFDTKDQLVYEIQAHDYANNRAYRWITESHREAWSSESESRGINKNEAWEDTNYIDLEVLDDLFEKMEGIRDGIVYDTRVQIPLTLGDEELFQLMKLAHESDITLNLYIENALREYIATAETV